MSSERISITQDDLAPRPQEPGVAAAQPKLPAPMQAHLSLSEEASGISFRSRAEAMLWILGKKGVAKVDGKPLTGPDGYFSGAEGQWAMNAFIASGFEFRRMEVADPDAIFHARLPRCRDSSGSLMTAKGGWNPGEQGWSPRELVEVGVGLHPGGDIRLFQMKDEATFLKEQEGKDTA
jgi:hypothetical protein